MKKMCMNELGSGWAYDNIVAGAFRNQAFKAPPQYYHLLQRHFIHTPENTVLMHHCAISAKDINLHFELWGLSFILWTLRFEIWTLWLHSMLLLSFIRTHRLRRLRPLGQWPSVQCSIFNSVAPADAIFPRRSFLNV